jgi:hypothetical protein
MLMKNKFGENIVFLLYELSMEKMVKMEVEEQSSFILALKNLNLHLQSKLHREVIGM